jgi:inhibitor of KinA
VIQIHTDADYRVYLLGFTPGFPYLGGMSPRIATPRLDEPRLQVPAGSVAIGGNQTGIYPTESAGGWRLIGRTPLKLFDLGREAPFLLNVGDSVHFRAITTEEFQDQQASNERPHTT